MKTNSNMFFRVLALWFPTLGLQFSICAQIGSRLARRHATVAVKLNGQNAWSLTPGCSVVAAEISGPPLALAILEERVVSAVRDGLIACPVRAEKVRGRGDGATVAAIKNLGTAQVVSPVRPEEEHALVPDVIERVFAKIPAHRLE